MPNDDTSFAFNGINASTGEPLLSPMPAEQIVRIARGEQWDPNYLKELRDWNELVQEDHLDVVHGIDPRKLSETGWGVIFTPSCSSEIREALAPLLVFRKAQVAQNNDRLYRELVYRPRESKLRFLARHGGGPGPVDPEVIPYYLMIVGSPEEIPFNFQYQLDVQYAVGRIHFDTAEEYARYAETVVAVESRELKRDRKVTFFGVENPDDRATERSLCQLVKPLAERLSPFWESWPLQKLLAEQARKSDLIDLLESGDAPAILLTASHGVGFDLGDNLQREHQGSLLCQDWPGPKEWNGPVPQDFYLSGEDIRARADVGGMIAFHFACYGAGTPRFDSFAQREKTRKQIAPECFVARLPQRLLAHPRGGALAVIAHVDRAWGYSFRWLREGKQIQNFESVLACLLDGYPVGAAMEYFNQRYAEISSDLCFELEGLDFVDSPDFLSLAGMWIANNDARSYVVLGDPAVRLEKQKVVKDEFI